MEYPTSWKGVKMSVIYKSGSSNDPKNYRPITIIPVMAKLFSTILYGRIHELIDCRLNEEQFGFRKGRGCSDAVHIIRTVIEKSAEWGEELWLAALDGKKRSIGCTTFVCSMHWLTPVLGFLLLLHCDDCTGT